MDPSQTIQDLTKNLKALKQHFDSGTTLQVAFVSSKMLEKVEKLGQRLRRIDGTRQSFCRVTRVAL
jgi:primosomal protein N''